MAEGWADTNDWTPPAGPCIDVWRLRLTVTHEDWGLLSSDEESSARRIVVEAKRNQKASSRARLRRILSRYVDADAKSLRFEYGEHGKPALAGHHDLSFNLSHSKQVGLVAVSRGIRLGIDVEQVRAGRDFSGLAERFFSPEESAVLARLPKGERGKAFYRAWTRKEAYLKALGTGLNFPSNAFTIDYVGKGPGKVTATEMPGDDPSAWRFADIRVAPEFSAALCFEGPVRPIRRWAPERP